jgi:hypothetical protein
MSGITTGLGGKSYRKVLQERIWSSRKKSEAAVDHSNDVVATQGKCSIWKKSKKRQTKISFQRSVSISFCND